MKRSVTLRRLASPSSSWTSTTSFASQAWRISDSRNLTTHKPSKTQQLRELLKRRQVDFIMEAHSGLSAAIVEEAGFKVKSLQPRSPRIITKIR